MVTQAGLSPPNTTISSYKTECQHFTQGEKAFNDVKQV